MAEDRHVTRYHAPSCQGNEPTGAGRVPVVEWVLLVPIAFSV